MCVCAGLLERNSFSFLSAGSFSFHLHFCKIFLEFWIGSSFLSALENYRVTFFCNFSMVSDEKPSFSNCCFPVCNALFVSDYFQRFFFFFLPLVYENLIMLCLSVDLGVYPLCSLINFLSL